MAAWEDVRRAAMQCPGVEEGTGWRGHSTLRVRGKLFACMSPREEGALVLRVDPDERPLMIEAEPDVYYVTPHYESSPYVLVRLEAVRPDDLAERVAEAWFLRAPKRLAATFRAR